jgi:RNA polymerase sigma factor (TIGR02999 family)
MTDPMDHTPGAPAPATAGGAPVETPLPEAHQVTLLIEAAARGDHRASAELLPLVYEGLRRLAEQSMRNESPGRTLQPTALVHEAYLRLVGGSPDVKWANRGHFFAAAAQAMRRILVERARHRRRIKHGGGRDRVALEEESLAAEPSGTDLIELDSALDRLREHDQRQHDVVMLRYFAGLSVEQVALCLGISEPTVKRDWTVARARLRREVEQALGA